MTPDENSIKITSSLRSEYSTEVAIGKDRYIVETDNSGIKTHLITTKIYLKGQIVSTRKTDYGDMLNEPDLEARVQELMHRQHKLAINIFKTEKTKEAKTPSDYIQEAQSLLRRKNPKSALHVLEDAIEQHPDDPFLLSYKGYLEASVNNNFDNGIETCQRAIKMLNGRVPFGKEYIYPVFYLNLGRAYLAADRKKEAIEAFDKGLDMDSDNKELLWERKKLGIRRRPAVPLLSRSNPLNKILGKIFKTKK